MNDLSAAPPVVPGKVIRHSRPYLIFILVGATVMAPCALGLGGFFVLGIAWSVVSDPHQLLGLFDEGPLKAVGCLLAVLLLVLFGLCSLAIGAWMAHAVVGIVRVLLADRRLVIGADRLQIVAGPDRVVGELLFTDVAEVKLVELESDSWYEQMVGFRLHGEKGLGRYLAEDACTIPRVRRWYNQRWLGCDLTLGGGWPQQAQVYEDVLTRFKDFRGVSKPHGKGKLTKASRGRQ